MIQKIYLAKRQLAFKLYGSDSLTKCIFYIHGYPGSLLEAQLGEQAAAKYGATIIALDRPGFGESSDYVEREIVHFPKDLIAVADHLKIDRFSIIAVSGGAPYACACALELGSRVTKVLIGSGVAPITLERGILRGMNFANRLSLQLAHVSPELGRILARVIAGSWRISPLAMLAWFYLLVSYDDRRILAKPEVRNLFKRNFVRALKFGTAGAAHELVLLAQDWKINLQSLTQPVSIWHGLEDAYVPAGMARAMARAIPTSQLSEFSGRGHFMMAEMMDEAIQNSI